MHFKGVPQIGIESSIPLRQPQCHTDMDTNAYILPWLMVYWWSIRDMYVLFLCMLSKIAYPWVNKILRTRNNLAPKLFTKHLTQDYIVLFHKDYTLGHLWINEYRTLVNKNYPLICMSPILYVCVAFCEYSSIYICNLIYSFDFWKEGDCKDGMADFTPNI